MSQFQWISFYEGFADKLLSWRDHKKELYEKIRSFASHEPFLHYLHFQHQQFWAERGFDIDPFTVTAIFNRGMTDAHRHTLGAALARLLNAPGSPPSVFHGIAHLDPRRSIYAGPDEIWELFARALSGKSDSGLAKAYDATIAVPGNALATLTIALFWTRPRQFMPLDGMSIPYIRTKYGIIAPDSKASGQEYLDFMRELEAKKPASGYPGIALSAWTAAHND